MGDITTLLEHARQGDRAALDRVFDALYPELRRIAQARLAGHVRDAAMQTTVLVHECYLKLLAAQRVTPAARAMRSVIVDTVRAARRERRGGAAVHVTLDTDVCSLIPAGEDEILDVDAALHDLERLEPRLAQVVNMRYFAGLKEAEIAAALGVTERTVRRDWEKARLLLTAALRR